MADHVLNITAEERDFLSQFLDIALKDAAIEEHRTKTLSYREHIRQREDLIEGLLKKLGAAKV